MTNSLKNTEHRFFLQEHLNRDVRHGGIGNIDIEKILLTEGFKPIKFPGEDSFSVKSKIRRFSFLISMILIPGNSWLVYQFPQHAFLNRLLVRILLRRKSVRVICHLTDIDGLKDGDTNVLHAEMELIRKHRYFIVHNDAMRSWLKDFHPAAKTESITFFDFLAPVPSNVYRKKSKSVVFAGNLAKSGFLSSLTELTSEPRQETEYLLYGPGHTSNMNGSSIKFKGVYQPYELPSIIEGSWGLVWDGESLSGMAGNLGEYMKYISHHKLSLYILAGLPLIVPQHSAAASIVKQYRIGIIVRSIDEISFSIDSLSELEYQQMIVNMQAIQPKISTGYFLKRALQNLMSQ